MKFHQLSIGSPFEFEGRRYIKSNSVMASDVDTGKQVFMKRSNQVNVGDELAEQKQAAMNQAQQVLHDALQAYRQTCLDILTQALADADPACLAQVNEQLEQSRIQLYREMSERLG